MTHTTGLNGLPTIATTPTPGAVRGVVPTAGAFGAVLAQMTPDAAGPQGQSVAAETVGQEAGGAGLLVPGAPNMAVMSLSPNLRVITDGGLQVSPQGLQAFAKAQGLSEDAISALVLQGVEGAAGAPSSALPGVASVSTVLSGGEALRMRGLSALNVPMVPVVGVGPNGALSSLGAQAAQVPVGTASGAMAAAWGGLRAPLDVGQGVVGGKALAGDAAAMTALGHAGAAAHATVAPGVVPTMVSAVGAVNAPKAPGALPTLGHGMGVAHATAVPGVAPTLGDAVNLANLLAGGVSSFASGAAAPAASTVNLSAEDGVPVMAAAPAAAAAVMLQMPQALALLRAKPAAPDNQVWRQEVLLEGVDEQDVAKLLNEGWTSTAIETPVGHGQGSVATPVSGAGTLPAPTDGQSLTAWHKQQFDALSDKLGEAVAQRIQAQIQRGHWNMSLNLRPHELGNVDVQLGMRGHDLSASFQASQALTRDLLQDSLPRLREMLAGAGIDVASADVGGQSGRDSGGNSTPARSFVSGESASAQSEPAPVAVKSGSPSADSGLDLWA